MQSNNKVIIEGNGNGKTELLINRCNEYYCYCISALLEKLTLLLNSYISDELCPTNITSI